MLRSALRKLALVFLSLTITFYASAQNQALDLSGLGNEVNVSYNLTTGPGFTVEQWINIPSLTQVTSLVNQSSGAIAAPMDAYVNGDGSVSAWFGNGGSSVQAVTAAGLITPGTWHHVAIVYDPASSGSECQIFIDGNTTPADTQAEPVGFTNVGPIRIGRRDDLTEGDDIYIDEVRIWSTSRDGATINADYNQQLIGNEANLDVYLRFENDLDDDAFVNLFQDGTFAGSIGYVAGAPIQENNYALDFDGINDEVIAPNNANFEFASGTVEFWFNVATDESANNAVVAMRDGTAANTRWSFHVNTFANTIGMYNGTAFQTVAASIDPNIWYHVAFNIDGTNTEVILDGISLGFTGHGMSGNIGRPLSIGSPNDITNFPTEYFPGQVDEVRLWNSQRSISQINAFKDVEVNPLHPGLVGYFDFSDGPNTSTLSDLKGGGPGLLTNMEIQDDWVPAAHGLSPAGPLDTTNPDVSITSSETDPTAANPIPITITFTEEVVGFDLSDISVSNGSPGNLNTADNIVFTADITPSASGIVSVDVFGATGTDLTGNFNNSSPTFNITYDLDPPFIRATALSANRTRIYVEFNENVYGAADGTTPVDAGDFTVGTAGGTASVIVNSLNVLSPSEIEFDITISGIPDGAEVVDVSPNGSAVYDAVGNEMSAIQTSNLIGLVDNSVLSFDGVDDYVNVPNDVAFELQQYTIEAWINLPNTVVGNTGLNYSIISKGSLQNELGIDRSGFSLFYGDDGANDAFLLGQESTSGTTEFFSVPQSLTPDTWYHVAGTYDGTTMRIFLDGSEIGNFNPVNPGVDHAGQNLNLKIGAFEGNGAAIINNYRGKLDEVRIWNYARTDVEITAEKDFILTGSESGLVAYYDFDDASGTNASESVAARNGTLTNFDLTGTTGNWASGGTLLTLPPPTAPTNVIAYPTSATAIRIDWTDLANNETGYNVERDTDPLFGTPTVVLNGGPADTQTFVDSPGADARVYYRVQPTNGSEDASSYSATEFGTTVAFPGDALQFDGLDDRVEVPHSTELDNVNQTIEGWFIFDDVGTIKYLAGKTGTPVLDGDYLLSLNNSRARYSIVTDAGTQSIEGSTILQTGVWYHLAGTKDGANINIYVNGQLDGTTTFSGTFTPTSSTNNFELGSRGPSTIADNHFDGLMDEIRVWSLSKTDFSDRFFFLQGNEPNLIAYYPMDEGIGATSVLDGSFNTNDGTLQNGPVFNPATFLDGKVTNTNDTGPGSLRDAIDYANLNPGTTITFEIVQAAPWVINLGTALPQITAANTRIDGDTQPGWIFGDPNAMVQIDGSGIVGNANGIDIDAANVEVYGLIFTGFTGNATNGNVYLASDAADFAVIGEANRGNIFHSSGGNAIYIVDGDSAIVRGNRIGTLDGTNASAMGDHGISTTGEIDDLIIGGDFATGEGNLISSAPSNRYGLNLYGDGTGLNDVTIKGNKIGTNEATTGALPNTLGGINISGTVNGVQIGGLSIINDLNIISGNGDHGIIIQAGNTIDIDGNYIGLQSNGTSPLGNAGSGIRINGAASNINIGINNPNFISQNIEFGIVYDGNSSSNTALGTNNIFGCNGNAGIGYGSGPLTPGATIDDIGLTTASVSTGAADGASVYLFIADDGCGNDQAIGFAGAGVVASGQATVSGAFAPGAHYVALVEDVNGFSTFSVPYFTNFVLVDNTNDTGTGSLRAAIDSVNLNPGTNIYFALPSANDTISVLSGPLPIISENTIIDATTQPGWNFSTGMIPTIKDACSCANGLEGDSDGSNIEIYGLRITGFITAGISSPTSAGALTIGAAGKGNIIVNNGNGGSGRGVQRSSANNFVLQGNYIGVEWNGDLAANNGRGVNITSGNSAIIGGLGAGEGNVISGSTKSGLQVNTASNLQIFGNYIGTDPTGTQARPNASDMNASTGGLMFGSVSSDHDIIGNIISGNATDGIFFQGNDNDTIQSNKIGVDINGFALGNQGHGINFNGNSSNNVVGGDPGTANEIGFNGGYGINSPVAGSINNDYLSNSILDNILGGIFHNGVANGGIAAPTINPIVSSSDVTGTGGTTGEVIELFLSDGGGQGEILIGNTITGGGTWSIGSLSLNPGDEVVATITELSNGTSEFSPGETFAIPYPAAEGAGEALAFDGTDDFVDISSFDVAGMNEITVEAWIKPDVIPAGPGNQYMTIVGKGAYGAAGNNSFALYLFGSDASPFSEIVARIDNGAAVEEARFDASGLIPGEWLHVAMTWNSGNGVNLYVNGVLEGTSSPIAGSINAVGDNIMIGSSAEVGELLFQGEIDEVRIWNFEQSESGIRGSITQKIIGNPGGLMAYYRMDDSGDVLNLSDVNGVNNGTIEGGASYVPSGAHLGDYSTFEYSYSAGSGRDLDNFRVINLGVANLPLHIYRVSGTPANNVIAGFDNIADTAYYGVFSPGQTYDITDSIGSLTPDRRIVFRNDGTDPTWESVSGAIGVDLQDDQLVAFGLSGSGQYATAIDQNPYPLPADAGYAMSFDGVSNQIVIPDGDEFSFGNTTTDQPFSAEAWVNFATLGTNQAIISKRQNGVNREYRLSLTSLNEIEVLFFDESNTGQLEAQTGPINIGTNEWHHIAFTYDGSSIASNIQIYLDGLNIASTPANILYTAMSNTPADLELGIDAGLIPLNGQLDEVRLWNIELGENNIRDHMIGKLDADFDSLNHLVAYYRFDDNNAVSAINLTGDTDGSVTGATPVISGVPQGQGSIYSYSGTPGILNTAQFGEDINVHYQDASNGIHGYLVAGAPNQVQVNGYDDLSQGKYYGVFAPGQKVEIRMDYNNGGSYDPDRRIVYRTDATDTAAVGGWERLSGLINSDVSSDSIFAYNVPTGEVAVATLNPPSTYPVLSDTDPGSALNFDGVNDHVTISHSEALDFEFDDAFSLEAWVTTPASGAYTLFSKISSGPTRGYRVTIESQIPSLQLFSDGGASNEIVVTTVETIPLSQPSHLVVTYDGSNSATGVSFYLDGVLLTNSVSNDNLSGTIQNTENLLIGIRNDLTSPFPGLVDEFRIWNAELAAGDVSAFANTTDIAGHPNYTDMVAYYKFDDGTGSTILEDVFSNNDGTLTNMDENTDWVPSGALAGAPEQNALNFDGDDRIDFVRQTFPAGLTYEAWINTTSTANTSVYEGNPALTVIGDNNNSIEGAFGVHDGRVRYTHWTGVATTFDQIDGNRIVNDGQWHHIAVTHENGTNEVRIYVDGVLDVVATSTIYATGISANRVGSSYLDGTGNDNFFVGDIDETRIWNAVLSEDEIRDYLYADDLTGSPSIGNLILHYNYNQGSAGGNNTGETAVTDQSSSTLDGTLQGFALNGATSNFVTSGNTSFSPVAPSLPASNIITSNIMETTVDLNWTNGDGQRRVVLVHEGTGNPFPSPADNVYGRADQYGLGDDLDGGWFVVYNGYADSTTVGGLVGGTDYEVAVLELNGPPNFEAYNGNSAVNNPISFTTATPITNFALDFDGTAQYVAVTDAPAFDIDTDWTIEAWIKTPNTIQQNIVSQIVANTGYAFFKIGGNLYLQYYSSGGFQNGANSLVVAAGIDDDQWHHVAVSQNGVNGKIYVDGALIHDVDVMLPIDETTEEVRIGYEDFVGALTGSVDEVRFWDYQRSDAEILTYYDSELVGNESGLVAYYSFNDGTGSTIAADGTGGGNDGVLTSMDENTDWIQGPTLNPPVTVPNVIMTTIPVAGTTLDAGTSDNLIYKFYLTANNGDATQQGMIVAVGGDAVAGDFSLNGWKLYESVNVDVADPLTATQVGATNIGDAAPDSVGFALSNTIFDSDTNYFYLVVDIDPGATVGNSFNVVLWNGDPTESIGIQDPKNKIDGGFVDGDTFTITGDATAPSVSNLTPSLGTIIDGDTQLDITIQFDEAMDMGVDPTITFPVEDPSNTLTPSGGVWDDAFNFTASYSIADANETLANIDVRVADAQDVAGNVMNIYDGVDAFNIDTENPVVTVDTYGTSITSPQLTGTIDDATATLDIEVDGSNYAATNNGDGTWTLGAGTITSLADGTYDVIATATDVSGNTGTDATIDELVISQSVVTLAAEDVTSTSFTARWSEGLDVQTYQVDVSTVADFSTFVTGLESFEINATSLAVANLDFSTQYYYRVRLVNTSDEVSANSNTTQVITIVDPETLADSTALRNIYDAISPQGLNWETARLRDWDGVNLDAGRTRVAVVDISGTTAAGDMPNPFTGGAVGGLSNMTDMNASDNQITGLMDFTGTTISNLNVSGNSLQFDDLEPVAGIATIDYANQASIQYNESTGGQIEVRYTNDYSLSINIGGSSNVYTWFRNDTQIGTNEDFIINDAFGIILAIDFDNMGTFRTEVTNPSVPGLTIDVDAQDVLAIADMQVSVTDASGNPLTEPLDGFMLETTRTSTGFRVLETVENISESTFTFPDVVLGDYIIFIESDLSLYIPTYFGDVFEWTEADTLFFRSDDVIAMEMVEVPPVLVEGDGDGTLDVLIEEDFGDEDGARIDARRRAAKRKCGVRRKRSGGRTGQDDDDFELIAYGETDDNGEFQFGFLPAGIYRFFVEYPGIPLDESSFVQFEVGEAGVSDTDFRLQAFASEDGIEVTIEAVLGVILDYFKNLQIYPNPSSEYLNIRYRHLKSQNVTAQLVDLSGSTKWAQDLRNGFDGEINIDVTDFEEGIYILRFYDREDPQGNVVSFRVMVRD